MSKLLDNIKVNNSYLALKENKTFKAILVCLFAMLILMFILNVSKGFIKSDLAAYQINKLKVNVDIDNSNRAYYKETYSVQVSKENAIVDLIIKLENNHDYITKIKSIKVDDYKYNVVRYDDEVHIYITLKKKENDNPIFERLINVSYVVDRGQDADNESDYINYNLLNFNSVYQLKNFEFNINFPKSVKSSINDIYSLIKIVDASNNEVNANRNKFKLSLINDGNTLTGMNLKSIETNNKVYFDHSVYNNYFEDCRNPKKDENKLIILYIVFFFTCFISFFLCGKDSTVLYSADGEIPKDMSPLLTRCFFNIEKDNKNITNNLKEEADLYRTFSSLLIKWANDGYLAIERYTLENNNETQKQVEDNIILNAKPSSSQYEYKIYKLREAMLSQMAYYEKNLFDGFFCMAIDGVIDTAVIKGNKDAFKDCFEYFKTQLKNAQQEVIKYATNVKDNSLDKKAALMKNNSKILSFVSFAICLFFNTLLYYTNIMSFTKPILFLILLLILYFVIYDDSYLINIVSTIAVLLLGYYTLNINIYSYILLSLTSFMIIIMRKYTFQYELIIEKIKGFRKFVNKKDRTLLVNTLNENPKYFYDSLPHAISLELEDKLIQRCNEFNIAMPGYLRMQPNEYSLITMKEIIDDITIIFKEL